MNRSLLFLQGDAFERRLATVVKYARVIAWTPVLYIERFSYDVTAAILVFQKNPVGLELFSHVNALFCSNIALMLVT